MTKARSITGGKESKKQPKNVKRTAKPYPGCLGYGTKKCDNFCKTGDTCLWKHTKCEIKHPPAIKTATVAAVA